MTDKNKNKELVEETVDAVETEVEAPIEEEKHDEPVNEKQFHHEENEIHNNEEIHHSDINMAQYENVSLF